MQPDSYGLKMLLDPYSKKKKKVNQNANFEAIVFLSKATRDRLSDSVRPDSKSNYLNIQF